MTMARMAAATVWYAALISGAASPASGQMTGAPTAGYKQEPGMTAAAMPGPLREIGFDQRINERIPLDATFTDEAGRRAPLGDYFGRRPVVMVFAYYDCPMLCTQVLNGLGSALAVLSLQPGSEIVTISFDPRDTPAGAGAKKAHYIERYKRPGAPAAWHFLTGDQASIDRVTGAAGFRYVWDTDTKQFAHPTGVIVLTPDGRLARYLFGIEYGPRDLRYALVEASDGKVGSPVDSLLLYCYHYDPMTGRYGLVIMRAVRVAGVATVLALGTFIVVMVRRETRQAPPRAARHPARGGR
jgi:protein SCO1/2